MSDADAPCLLLTRPEESSLRFRAELEAAWGGALPAIISPLIGIEAIRPGPLDPPDALILTSGNGVAAAARLGFGRVPAWCVGARTADLSEEAGLRLHGVAEDAEALVAQIAGAAPEGRLLHLRGEYARGDVAERLRDCGLSVTEAVVYRQAARPLSSEARERLAGRAVVTAPVFSPRTGALLAAEGPFAAPLSLIAMSGAVAEALAPLGAAELCVAARPDAAAMVAATIGALERAGIRRPGA